jgi:peptidoglycan-associated lipoprotein
MKNELTAVLTALVFVTSVLLLMVSCAKKEYQVSEPGVPTTERRVEEVKKPEPGVPEAYREEEAKRQARLRELEREQALANQIRAFESASIYFDFDRSDLKPEAQAVLREKADWMREPSNQSYSIWIEGHCDERGTNEYNLALGERRAHAAKKFLVALGIPEQRIRTISYGEERPADPGRNEEAWAKNRRDDFKVIR